MPSLHCPLDDAVVVLIDVQPTFMSAIFEADRVVRRSRFLIQIANMLQIPVIATEQYRERMGGLDPALAGDLAKGTSIVPKMSFSCWGAEEFRTCIRETRRGSMVLVGIETHICVSLTALDLLDSGFDVFVCPDAAGARSNEMHKLGMERMRDAGVMPAHTESLAYEWMGAATHPKFKDALKVVKEFAS